MKAALREAAMHAARAVPLAWSLAALRAASRLQTRAAMPWFEPVAAALGLDASSALAYARRSWWGTHADGIVKARLATRPDEVMARVVGFDTHAIDEARAERRGVLLVSAHIGPSTLLGRWLHDRYPDMVVVARRGTSHGARRVMRMADAGQRGSGLVEIVRELRAGGLVFIYPDGKLGERPCRVPLGAGRVPLGLGAPTLARLSGAAVVPVVAAWRGERVHLEAEPRFAPEAAAAAPGRSSRARDEAWLAGYVALVDRWQRALPPENIRRFCNLYMLAAEARHGSRRRYDEAAAGPLHPATSGPESAHGVDPEEG